MSEKRETRHFTCQIETRENETGEPQMPVITGFPIVYNSKSENFGSEKYPIYEYIDSHALDGVIETSDVRALYNHGNGGTFPFGRTKAKTLELENTPTGLMARIYPPNTEQGRGLVEAIRRGDLGEMSFAFTITENGDKWEKRGNADVRTITKIEKLYDISIVDFPAYPDTSVALERRNIWNTENMEKPAQTDIDDVLSVKKFLFKNSI